MQRWVGMRHEHGAEVYGLEQNAVRHDVRGSVCAWSLRELTGSMLSSGKDLGARLSGRL